MSEFKTFSSDETEKIGEDFARQVRIGETVSLVGDLGAGKTTFVRGFMRGLGYEGSVRSPSYTISNRYPSTPPVTHLDLFRMLSGLRWINSYSQ